MPVIVIYKYNKEKLTMKDKDLERREIQKLLLDGAKKLREKRKQVKEKEEDNKSKITDPLKDIKAIVKYYGTHNRLQ